MPPKRGPIERYFQYEENGYVCTIGVGNAENGIACSYKIKTFHSGNMERHIKTIHPETYNDFKKIKLQKVEKSQQNKLSFQKKRDNTNIALQPNAEMKIPITCYVHPKDMEDIAIKTVTIDGRPFRTVMDSGMSKMFNILKKGYEKANIPHRTINRESVREMTIEKANLLTKTISSILSKKIISLKMDGAVRGQYSFLGVSAQLYDKGIFQSITLACIVMEESHTAIHIRKRIEEILQSYNVELHQIYAVVTDNGANFVSSVAEMNKVIVESEKSKHEFDDDIENISDSDSEVISSNVDKMYEKEEGLLQEVEKISFGVGDMEIKGIRCAAHTLQLAVNDALKQSGPNGTIIKVRLIMKKLRTKKYLRHFKKYSKIIPIVDCITRWMSTFDMVKQFKSFHTAFIAFKNDMIDNDDIKSFAFSSKDWENIDNLIIAMAPSKEATIKLQAEEVNLCILFKIWTECIIETKKVGSTFANTLVEKLEDRKKRLFDNNIILSAALFLNPKLKVIVNKTNRDLVKNHLKQLLTKIIFMKDTESFNDAATTTMEHGEDEIMDVDVDEEKNELDEFEKYLKMQIKENEVSKENKKKITSPIDRIIQNLSNSLETYEDTMFPDFTSKSHYTNEIIGFWNDNKNKTDYPYFSELAEIILATPCTQCSVERLFSNLRFILTELRQRMLPDTINKILLIRMNKKMAFPLDFPNKLT